MLILKNVVDGMGCVVHGKSYEKALARIRAEIQMRIEDSLGDNEDIPQAETVNFTTLRLRESRPVGKHRDLLQSSRILPVE